MKKMMKLVSLLVVMSAVLFMSCELVPGGDDTQNDNIVNNDDNNNTNNDDPVVNEAAEGKVTVNVAGVASMAQFAVYIYPEGTTVDDVAAVAVAPLGGTFFAASDATVYGITNYAACDVDGNGSMVVRTIDGYGLPTADELTLPAGNYVAFGSVDVNASYSFDSGDYVAQKDVTVDGDAAVTMSFTAGDFTVY